ncbi:hypothetical protein FGO68_gene3340 [Halteria grandinella]|uniref:Uncharacterized protein n=1 Tax=Halteria grandinella TaxID=5974 RepID=A0A8J8NJL6_HALGN|nr:hypothetical protein FGO68_gene3340 [Halteria grandinella]
MNSAEIPEDTQPVLLKLVMIGWQGVGKSSFISRFHYKEFPHPYSTISVEFVKHKVIKEGRECKYQIWDPAGAERFRVITQSFYRHAHGLFIFVDLSITVPIEEQIDHWMKESEKYSSDNVCRILIGSKCDLPQIISDEACEKYAQQYKMAYFKTSAKEGINVTEAVESLMESVFQQIKDQNFQNIQLQIRYRPQIQQGGNCC